MRHDRHNPEGQNRDQINDKPRLEVAPGDLPARVQPDATRAVVFDQVEAYEDVRHEEAVDEAVDEEEGAYIDLELTGGQQYILVVGSDGTGPYELTIQAVVD